MIPFSGQLAPQIRVTTLERLRLEHGLSGHQVERRSGVNRKTLRGLERCIPIRPHASTMQRLAILYDVRPEWLLREYLRDRFERTYGTEQAA